jgi:flagellar protein FliS
LTNRDPVKTYKETQIKTATQGKLILMLYDGAIRNLNNALENMRQEHRAFDVTNNYLIKTQDIITELMVSLDFEQGGEIAKNLFNLYVFMNRRLLEGNIGKKEEPLLEVRKLLSELRSVWAEVVTKKGVTKSAGAMGGINFTG